MPQTEVGKRESKRIASRKYNQSHKTQNASYHILWYHKNKERLNGARRELWLNGVNRMQQKQWVKTTETNLRKQVINGYGGKCACCGETEYYFMDIDHINNDGKKDRDKFNDFRAFYRWLRDNGFPKDNYQLLCSNCNQGKRRNRGVCPHQQVIV